MIEIKEEFRGEKRSILFYKFASNWIKSEFCLPLYSDSKNWIKAPMGNNWDYMVSLGLAIDLGDRYIFIND